MRSERNHLFSVFFLFLILFCIISSTPAAASDFLFYKEVNAIGGYSNKEEWIGKTDELSNTVGFEHYGKFSSAHGDFLTTDLQVRFAYDSSENSTNAWSVEIHNAWIEYRASPEVKIKGGHFEPAFGLETVIDAHSTILQTLAMDDIGFTRDWGAEIRGSMPAYDYAAAFQIGSGMSIRREDSSFLVTARVGTPQSEDLRFGVSGLIGNIIESYGMSTFPKNHLLSKDTVFKERIGFDMQYNFWNSFLFKGEAAYGINDKKNVLGYMTEVDYTAPRSQNWSVETQFKSWFNDMKMPQKDDTTFSLCLSYKLSQTVTLRAAVIHDLNMYSSSNGRDTRALLQFYYYGK
jgi:hypothetical protein